MKPDEKRVGEIDVLRGFAMLGVFIVNFVEMNTLPPGLDTVFPIYHDAIDSFVQWLYHGTFHGKFYLIFVFLFGYSLPFTVISATKKGLNVDAIVMRRMTALMLIGVVLSGLCWWGVILMPYALFGFIMWGLVRAFSEKINITIATLLVVAVPTIANNFKLANTYEFILDKEALTTLFSNGGFWNWVHLIPVQLKGVYWGFFTDGMNSLFYPGQIAYMSMLLGLFMLGWYAAMHKVITNTSIGTYVGIIAVGILVYACACYFDPKDNFYFLRLSQTLAMSASVIILSRLSDSPLTRLFSLVGRTSFSAYAFHLILGAVVFFILGYFQRFSYGILLVLALATYLMAAAACWVMQRKYGAGIFEVLMKRLTFGN